MQKDCTVCAVFLCHEINLNKENSPASKRSVGGGMNPLQENGIL